MERKYRAISGQENAYCRTCPSYRGDEATPTRTIAAWRSKTWAIDAMLRVYRTLSHDKSDLLVRNSRQARIYMRRVRTILLLPRGKERERERGEWEVRKESERESL